MTMFNAEGDKIIRPIASASLMEGLPVGTYQLKADQRGWYLQVIDNYATPAKVYGDLNPRAERIINTFKDRPSQTGVLLSGEKGSGKTLLVKRVSELLRQHESISTLIIADPFIGGEFNSLISSIKEPLLVVFDEFEKVYDKEKQQHALTLLDGTFPSKKLFALTINDPWGVDTHLKNRPGRIFYAFDYRGLDPNFVREYAEERLHDKTQVDGLVQVAAMFNEFNFDMLASFVEEMNRYGETAKEALRYLNANPSYNSSRNYKTSITAPDGEALKPIRETYSGNPLADGDLTFSVIYQSRLSPELMKAFAERKGVGYSDFDFDDMDEDTNLDVSTLWSLAQHAQFKSSAARATIKFDAADFVTQDGETMIFRNPAGFECRLTRQAERFVRYY